MLAKEKRIVVRSLAVGVVAALGVLVWQETATIWQAMTVRMLVAECKKSGAAETAKLPKNDPARKFELLCDPADLSGTLVGIQKQVHEASEYLETERHRRLSFPLLTLVIFALPLVWYFLLDRIREIIATVAGWDRDP